MKSQLRFIACASLFLAVAAGWLCFSSPSPAAPASDHQQEPKPVESDMHEFMEYVFQPTYKRLKQAMATEPEGNATWKSIKADSLILAEGGNLLLIRKPKDDAADWTKHATDVRNFGGQLYRAAKSKDYKTARKNYQFMLKNCNACHQQFAGGEHILKP